MSAQTQTYPDPGQVAREVLSRHIDPGVPVALLDYPDHSNVGDSAIWAGEEVFLREIGCEVRYTCDVDNFNEAALRRRMPFGQILLHGGGNFGTVWPRYQAFREMVLQRFRDYRIVQMPQSIHFNDSSGIDRTRRFMSDHPAFTLLVRDRESYQLALEALGVEVEMCPDSAMMLRGTLTRRQPVVDVLVLARTDKELKGGGLGGFSLPGKRVEVADWLDEEGTALRGATQWVKKLTHGASFGGRRFPQKVQRRLFRNLGDERIERGVVLLSRGKVVVTDRLHAHIISTLLGIPHVVLDNSYGKLSRFINCWHPDNPLFRVVGDVREAEQAAAELLAR